MKKTKSKRHNTALVVGLSVFLGVILLGFIIVLLVIIRRPTDQGNESTEVQKRNIVVTEENVERVIEDLSRQSEEEQVAPGYYTVTMNNEWHFATGDSASSDAFVSNDLRNTNDVYFDVVFEENEDEVIYKSPVIPLGGELHNIALDSVLEAGSYNCIAIYHLIDEEQNTIDTLRVRLMIIVES